MNNVAFFIIGLIVSVLLFRGFRTKTFLEAHYDEQKALSETGDLRNTIAVANAPENQWISEFPGVVMSANPFSGPKTLPTPILGVTSGLDT